jgi:hypothetical protein
VACPNIPCQQFRNFVTHTSRRSNKHVSTLYPVVTRPHATKSSKKIDVALMSTLVTVHETLRASAPGNNKPSSGVQFKMMTNYLKNQPAKQPAVATQTKATLGTATYGSCPDVPSGAMRATQTVGTTLLPAVGKSGLNNGQGVVAAVASGTSTATNAAPEYASTIENASCDWSSLATITKLGHKPQLFNGTATGILLTFVVVLGSILTAGMFVPEIRLVGVLSMLLAAVSLYLILSRQWCRVCTVNKGQQECNAILRKLFLLRTIFVAVDTMMTTVKVVLQTLAFVECNAFFSSRCQDPAKAVVGLVFGDESENVARKIKIRGHCSGSGVRRNRCGPLPSAFVFFALALICGIDLGWADFTPNASQSAQANEVLLALWDHEVLLASFEHEISWASFENEKNATVVFDVPKPIIHPSWNEIVPTTCSIICQGLCPEGQNQGTASVIVSPFFICRRFLLLK